jgi:hypothetical protein
MSGRGALLLAPAQCLAIEGNGVLDRLGTWRFTQEPLGPSAELGF